MLHMMRLTFIWAIMTIVVGTVLSTVLGMILPVVPLTTLVGAFLALLALIYVISYGAGSKIYLFPFLAVLAATGIVAEILVMIIPQISQYIVTLSAFTVTGLVWTAAYVGIAYIVMKKYNLD